MKYVIELKYIRDLRHRVSHDLYKVLNFGWKLYGHLKYARI